MFTLMVECLFCGIRKKSLLHNVYLMVECLFFGIGKNRYYICLLDCSVFIMRHPAVLRCFSFKPQNKNAQKTASGCHLSLANDTGR